MWPYIKWDHSTLRYQTWQWQIHQLLIFPSYKYHQTSINLGLPQSAKFDDTVAGTQGSLLPSSGTWRNDVVRGARGSHRTAATRRWRRESTAPGLALGRWRSAPCLGWGWSMGIMVYLRYLPENPTFSWLGLIPSLIAKGSSQKVSDQGWPRDGDGWDGF